MAGQDEGAHGALPTADDEQLTSISWVDKEWLAHFPLITERVLDYFSRSPFYDPACNNETLRVQGLDPANLPTMVGIEYVVTGSHEPSLFVITKFHRSAPHPYPPKPLAAYYVAEGNVYQCPTIGHVLSSRALHAVHHIRAAFTEIHQHVGFTPDGTHVWTPPPPRPPLDRPGAQQDNKGQPPTAASKAVDKLLYGILENNRRSFAEMAPKPVVPERQETLPK